VKNIEVVRFVFWEQRRGHRIYDCFTQSISNRENEHSPEQTHKGRRFTPGGKRHGRPQSHQSRNQMQNKRKNHEPAVTDLVSHKRAKDDHETKSGKTTTGDRSQLRHRKTELLSPLPQDSTAD
jgi:hypothetical protein